MGWRPHKPSDFDADKPIIIILSCFMTALLLSQHIKPSLPQIMLQEQQTALKRKEYGQDEELFTELGQVVYNEGRLQDVYAGIGLPRCTKKMGLVMQEYKVVRERGLAVSQRLARHAERATLQPHYVEESTCGFCRTPLSTAQRR